MEDSLKREKLLSEEVVNIMVSFPKAVLLASNISEKNALMEIKKELTLHLFENKTLSFGKARQLVSLTKWEFMDLLRERKIPLHYDIKEYEKDLETLKEIYTPPQQICKKLIKLLKAKNDIESIRKTS